MSSYTSNLFRKRSSDDDSSDDSDDDLPPVKKSRTTFRNVLAEKCQNLFTWVSDWPMNYLNYTMSHSQPAEEDTDEFSEGQQEILLDDSDFSDNDIQVTEVTSAADTQDHHVPYSRGTARIPITTSTPIYRDGTMVGFKPKVPSMNGYHSKDPKTNGNLRRSQKQQRSNNRCLKPISNPGIDVEILLDSRDDSEDLKIVSEIDHGSKFSGFSMSPITVFDSTSGRSRINGIGPSTSRQDSKFYDKGFTAHKLVRLQEKAQYELLLEKIVTNSIYRPVKKRETPVIQIDLTQDDDDIFMRKPLTKEPLSKPCIEKYFKPCKLVPLTSLPNYERKKSPAKEDKGDIAPVLPEFRHKFKSKPSLFSEDWIKELKASICEETEKRLKVVKQQEDKITRFRERRDAKFEEEKKLFEKYKVPGDVFPEESVETNDFPDLTPEMEELIKTALNSGRPTDEMCTLNGVTVLRQHLRTLEGSNWLIDEVLNFYLNLIVERSKLDNYPTAYTFSTFFMASLRSRGIPAVLRWTRKVDIFSYDLIFIPLHLEVHWALCVVDNRSKTIRYYDSMGSGQSDGNIRYVHEYLIAEKKAKKNEVMEPTEYVLEVVKGLPKQMNGSDCGMFTLKYAEYISRDVPITFEQAHISYFRRRMIYEILSSRLL